MVDSGPPRLSEIRNRWKQFEERRKRAASRLGKGRANEWYFAILGLETRIATFDFTGIGRIQKVIEPPGGLELAAALADKHLIEAIGRYSPSIEYELAVSQDEVGDDRQVFVVAAWIISALRVKTGAELLVPVAADYSWSTIAALTDGTCHAQMIEDVPKARQLGPRVVISNDEFLWVNNNLVAFINLLKSPKFRLAVDAINTHHQMANLRMAAAMLWAGIEALFNIQAELRFRLSTVIASILEPRGQTRRDLYRKVKRLYDVRSAAIHGASLQDDKLAEHVKEVRFLLSQLLCNFTQNKHHPSEQELEDFIFR